LGRQQLVVSHDSDVDVAPARGWHGLGSAARLGGAACWSSEPLRARRSAFRRKRAREWMSWGTRHVACLAYRCPTRAEDTAYTRRGDLCEGRQVSWGGTGEIVLEAFLFVHGDTCCCFLVVIFHLLRSTSRRKVERYN